MNPIYYIPEVKAACERADRRYETTGNHHAVYCDLESPASTWTTPSTEPIPGKTCIFDTADGGRLL